MKKLIALLLAALMLLSLAACAAKPAETKTEEPAKTTEEPAKTGQPSGTEEAPAAAEGKYDVTGLENVTIVFATANAAANIESIYANRFMELVKDYSKKNNHDQFVRAWKELGRYSGSVKHYVELLEKYGITHINRC